MIRFCIHFQRLWLDFLTCFPCVCASALLLWDILLPWMHSSGLCWEPNGTGPLCLTTSQQAETWQRSQRTLLVPRERLPEALLLLCSADTLAAAVDCGMVGLWGPYLLVDFFSAKCTGFLAFFFHFSASSISHSQLGLLFVTATNTWGKKAFF